MVFGILIAFVIAQRLVELRIARRNELWMKKQGAKEYGERHYIFMVLIHVSFFVSLIAEVFFVRRGLSPYWPFFLAVFILVQLARVWVIASLGKYWNTKIIVLPNIQVVAKGPFKYVRHPNYLIVTIELIVIPLIFQAYFTAIIFFVLNQVILAIRIPAEEKALRENTDYGERFG